MQIDLKNMILGAGIVSLLLGTTAMKGKNETYVAVTGHPLSSVVKEMNEYAEEGYRLNTGMLDHKGRYVMIMSK